MRCPLCGEWQKELWVSFRIQETQEIIVKLDEQFNIAQKVPGMVHVELWDAKITCGMCKSRIEHLLSDEATFLIGKAIGKGEREDEPSD